MCLMFIGSVFAQEKFTVPERTVEQKFHRALYSGWTNFAAGIMFAKSQGLSAYEYGQFVGKEFAKSWNKENGFDGFVRGMLFNYESSRFESDDEIVVKEIDDGTVIIEYPTVIFKRYFPEDNIYVSYEDAKDCFKAVLFEIGDYLGCKVSLEEKGDVTVNTFTKK